MNSKSTFIIPIFSVLVMILLYTMTSLGWMGDSPVGQTGSYEDPLIVPEGYAFSIWSVIYLSLIAFPIYQWTKRKERTENEWHQIRMWFSANVVANGLWLVFASYQWLWTTVGLIIFLLISLVRINQLVINLRKKEEDVNFWFERVGFSIYFAWITLATALNFSAALAYYQWDGFGINPVLWAIVILIVAAAIAGFVSLKNSDKYYAGVVVWAFVALAVRHFSEVVTLGYLGIGVALTFLMVIFYLYQINGRQIIK